MHWGSISHSGQESVIQRHSTYVIAIDLAINTLRPSYAFMR